MTKGNGTTILISTRASRWLQARHCACSPASKYTMLLCLPLLAALLHRPKVSVSAASLPSMLAADAHA